jgi:methylmalonyl-CoA/ethylmalonyl-CoA epimerase
VKLHHVGIVVANLETAGAQYAGALGLEPAGPPVEDAVQQVRVQFWARPGDEVSVELIEPLAEASPTAQQVRNGGGYAHLCYEVGDIDAEVQTAWERGGIVVHPPAPAAAFGKRRIAFVCFRGIGIVEFVENDRAEDNDGGA